MPHSRSRLRPKQVHDYSNQHNSRSFDNTLPSFVTTSSHPPDASDISPASSDDALSPQSRVSDQSSSQSSSYSSSLSTRVPLDMSADGPCPISPEDYPLVSRDPSRGPSKGSLRSVDPTNMHSPSSPHGLHYRGGDTDKCDRLRDGSQGSSHHRPLSRIAAEREHVSKPRGSIINRSHVSSRSVSHNTSLTAYSFINDADRRRHEAERAKRKEAAESRRLWEQHIANKRKFLRPQIEQRDRSVVEHRMFNLKVRELQRQEELQRTGVLTGASSRRSRLGHNNSTLGGGNDGQGFNVDVTNHRRRGPTFWELQSILYNEFIHQIVPQQLKWIGRSGDRDRCAVPPMMATSAPRDPTVLTRQVNTIAHNQRQRKDANYREVQEEKWFAAAQRRFHSIAQHE